MNELIMKAILFLGVFDGFGYPFFVAATIMLLRFYKMKLETSLKEHIEMTECINRMNDAQNELSLIRTVRNACISANNYVFSIYSAELNYHPQFYTTREVINNSIMDGRGFMYIFTKSHKPQWQHNQYQGFGAGGAYYSDTGAFGANPFTSSQR